MDLKILGERLRVIRKYLGQSQKQIALATNLTQPVLSRVENGEEVYASALLAILQYYRGKISVDNLLDEKIGEDSQDLFVSPDEQKAIVYGQLSEIEKALDESKKRLSELKDTLG